MSVVNYKRVKVHGEVVVGIGKRVATNKNGFEIEFEMKNFKARSSEIEVMMHAKKNGMSLNGEVKFLHMNSQLMSRLGKGDLDHRAQSNTICWHVCNLCLTWWSKLLNKKLEANSKDERNDDRIKRIWWKMLSECTRWKQKKPPTLKTQRHGANGLCQPKSN